jgi:hypothetical protein
MGEGYGGISATRNHPRSVITFPTLSAALRCMVRAPRLLCNCVRLDKVGRSSFREAR